MAKIYFLLVLVMFSVFIGLNALAQTGTAPATSPPAPAPEADPVVKIEDLKALDYPELQVVPRASERLALEAGAVRDRGVMLLFPYMASSVMTLSSGLLVNSSIRAEIVGGERQDAVNSAKLAMGVGAIGLGLVYWYSHTDNYGATLAQIRSFKNRDRRTELFKERLAEEAFEKSAAMITQWKWIFAATNFLASAGLTGKSSGDTNLVPSLSVAASLLPLLITTSYETNYQKQLEYKRKIYVPLTWFDYGYNPQVSSWQPQLHAIWTF